MPGKEMTSSEVSVRSTLADGCLRTRASGARDRENRAEDHSFISSFPASCCLLQSAIATRRSLPTAVQSAAMALAIGGQVIIVSIAGKGVAEKLLNVGARPRSKRESSLV